MKRTTHIRRGSVALVALAAFGSVAASPGQTFAADTALARDTMAVTGTCAAVAGVNTGLNTMTFAIHAEGRANDSRWIPAATFSPTPSGKSPIVPPPGPQDVVGVATTVSCDIVDRVTGEAHGRVAVGLPGPAAAVAGTVEIPRSAEVYARVCVSAVFADGELVDSCS